MAHNENPMDLSPGKTHRQAAQWFTPGFLRHPHRDWQMICHLWFWGSDRQRWVNLPEQGVLSTWDGLLQTSLAWPTPALRACRNPSKSQNMYHNIWWEYMAKEKRHILVNRTRQKHKDATTVMKARPSRQLEAFVIVVYIFDIDIIKSPWSFKSLWIYV